MLLYFNVVTRDTLENVCSAEPTEGQLKVSLQGILFTYLGLVLDVNQRALGRVLSYFEVFRLT